MNDVGYSNAGDTYNISYSCGCSLKKNMFKTTLIRTRGIRNVVRVASKCIPNRASRKFYLTAAGIRTRDLRISRTMHALPSELQGQAENNLLSYDVSCISEVIVLQCVKPAIIVWQCCRLCGECLLYSEFHAISQSSGNCYYKFYLQVQFSIVQSLILLYKFLC